VNRVTHDIVERAAETLELRPVRTSRFAWLRRGPAVQAAARTHTTTLSYR
jgi:hypothetical protein